MTRKIARDLLVEADVMIEDATAKDPKAAPFTNGHYTMGLVAFTNGDYATAADQFKLVIQILSR